MIYISMDSDHNDPNLSSTVVSSDISPTVEKTKEQRLLSGHWESSPGIDLSNNFNHVFDKARTETLSSYAYPSKLELKENELVTVKYGTAHHGDFEVVKKIPKEEAICRFCFNVYKYNMLQTKCRCGFSMIHESCATEWSQKKGNNKCNVCEQDIEKIPITVSWDHSSASTRITKNNELKIGSSTTRKRFWGCFSVSF